MTTKQKHGSLIGHEKGNSGSINTHQSILSLPPGMCFQSTLHCELGRDDRPTTMRSTKGCGRAFSIRTAMPPTRRTWGNTRRAFECGRWRNRTYVCSMDEEDVDKIIGAHKGCAIFDCKVSMTLLLVRPLSFVFCVYVCISNTCFHGSGLLLLLLVLRMYLHFILFLKRSWYKKDFSNYFHYSIHHRLKNKQKTWSRSQDTHLRCLKGYLKRPQGSRFTKESVARRKHGHRAKHSVEKYIIKSQSTLGHIKYIKYQRKARHLFTGCMGTMYIPINCNLTLSINPFPTTHIRPLHTGWSLWYGE